MFKENIINENLVKNVCKRDEIIALGITMGYLPSLGTINIASGSGPIFDGGHPNTQNQGFRAD